MGDEDAFLLLYSLVVTVTWLFYLFFDVNYLLRAWLGAVRAQFPHRTVKPDETTVIYGMCTTQDLDIVFSHMNNARYLRELDFARADFFAKTRLGREIQRGGGHVFYSACNIRYRRTVPLFCVYSITTKIISWDTSDVFLEHQFRALGEDFVRTVCLSRQTVTKVNLARIIARLNGHECRPKPLEELAYWKSSMQD